MSVDPLNLPQLLPNVPIVDMKTGAATQYFSDYIAAMIRALTIGTNAINANIMLLQTQQAQIIANAAAAQAAAAAAAQAQGTADVGGSARSGDGLSSVHVNGSPLVAGPQVNLTGVSAGALTISGTSIYQGSSTQVLTPGTWSGNFRIVEIVGAVETQVYAGTYSASLLSFDNPDVGSGSFTILSMDSDPSSFSSARVSTGAVSYRLDLNLPGAEALNVQAYLSVRRA